MIRPDIRRLIFDIPSFGKLNSEVKVRMQKLSFPDDTFFRAVTEKQAVELHQKVI